MNTIRRLRQGLKLSLLNKTCVIDVETDREGNLILIGSIFKNKYYYFTEPQEFIDFLKTKKIRQVFAHNLEFDFFKTFENVDIKFCGHYNSFNLAYIQTGNTFYKDTYNHLPYKLKYLGYLIGIEKKEIDYDTLQLNKELIDYNKIDCRITYEVVKKLINIYINEGCTNVKSTSGGQALDVFNRRFNGSDYRRLKKSIIDEWRKGYKGGWTECFETGYFTNDTFYKIDVNSLYPYVMTTSYPDPYFFKRVKRLTNYQIKYYFWLGVRKEIDRYTEEPSIFVYNSVEDRDIINTVKCDYFYLFNKRVYPFKRYVDYYYRKKAKAKGLEREIFKRLMNALYGKFGQKNTEDIITNYDYNTQNKHILKIEQITDKFYRIEYENSYNKFWVNIIWSLFTTAKARYYMAKLKSYVERRGLRVYYTDSDSFIISGDIEKIATLINNKKLGLFKLEDMSNEIEIKGKKMYRFGNIDKCVRDCTKCQLEKCIYTCKGVPKQYQRQFFNDGYVQFKKMVRLRTSFRTGKRFGTFETVEKTNKANINVQLPLDN